MRLLFVLYGSLEQVSGGYLYDRKVIEYLGRRGVAIDLLSLPACPYLLCPLHFFRSDLKGLLRGAGGAETCGSYDVIIIDELTHPSVFLSVLKKSGSCPPVLILLHHLKCRERIGGFKKMLARYMESSLLAGSDGIIVNSRTTEQTVRQLVGGRIPVRICPPGSDAPSGGPSGGKKPSTAATVSRRSWNGSGRPLRLLTTGNVIPRKGHDLLARILAGLADLDWELRVVGSRVSSPYLRRLDRLIRRFRLEQRILFTGVLSAEALQREYGQADIFVFPSRYEGFGISLAEALRAGLPFVAFSTGAIPEVTGGRGLLLPDGDSPGFRSCLARLISDPKYRAEMAELSREIAAGLPAWDDTGRKFLEAVKGLAGCG